MRNLTLKQLRAFVMVAKEGSFTRAAARLNLSQSALTLQVRDLEAEAGLKLLNRTTRSVELTNAGRGFLPLTERLLDELGVAVDDLRALARGEKGSVAVVAGGSVISLVVAPALAAVAKTYPGISVRISEAVGEEAAGRVITGQVDFGIAAFVAASAEIDSTFLLKDRFGILCAKDHALAHKCSITWSDLRHNPFVTLTHGASVRGMLCQHPDIGTLLPRPNYEVSSMSAMISIVEHGAAIALLPSVAAFPALGRRLVFRQLHEPAAFRQLFFIASRRRTLTPASRRVGLAVLAQLQSLCRRHRCDLIPASDQLAELCRKLEPAV